MEWLTLGLAAASLAFLLAAWSILRPLFGARRPPLPPEKSGLLPWVGCAIPFGKDPLNFIQRARKEFGTGIFTIHVAGKRITFVALPDQYSFFSSPHLDFQVAVQPFTQNAAGVSPDSFKCHHTALHDSVKGHLVPACVARICPTLSEKFYSCLNSYGDEGEMDLMEFVRHAMFEAVVREFFGSENAPQTQEGIREMEAKFVKYDLDFEYGCELPEIFLKEWRNCKYWLLSLFKVMVAGIQEKETKGKDKTDKLLVESLLAEVDKPHSANYVLLLLWATQANAVPCVFWTLAYVLSDASVQSALRSEVDKVPLSSEGGEFQPLDEAALSRVPLAKRCVMEANRLRSPGMILRKVTTTHTVMGYTVPAGHLLALSPYWIHRNPDKFPAPDSFNPDRWLECDLAKNQLLDGFVGFGGGRYHCPGRWFALMEMPLFVAMVMKMYDLELVEPLPPPSPLHLVGVPQPQKPCRVRYRRRPLTPAT